MTRRVSVGPGGRQADAPSGGFGGPAISADGRFVAFASLASNLVAGDTNGTFDVFVRDEFGDAVSLPPAGAAVHSGG